MPEQTTHRRVETGPDLPGCAECVVRPSGASEACVSALSSDVTSSNHRNAMTDRPASTNEAWSAAPTLAYKRYAHDDSNLRRLHTREGWYARG